MCIRDSYFSSCNSLSAWSAKCHWTRKNKNYHYSVVSKTCLKHKRKTQENKINGRLPANNQPSRVTQFFIYCGLVKRYWRHSISHRARCVCFGDELCCTCCCFNTLDRLYPRRKVVANFPELPVCRILYCLTCRYTTTATEYGKVSLHGTLCPVHACPHHSYECYVIGRLSSCDLRPLWSLDGNRWEILSF